MLPLLDAPTGKTPYILIADDSESDSELAQLAFSRLDFVRELVWVRDGEAAWERLSSSQMRLPQLVLVDLHMPKLDGFELVQRVRRNERSAAVPIVLMSASAYDADVRKAVACGANSYVMKPVDFQLFTDQLTLIARYWLEVHRTPASP